MKTTANSLAALREQAAAGVNDLIEVLALGHTLGAHHTPPEEVRRRFRVLDDFDVSGMEDDGRRLSSAYRAVVEQVHGLSEQQTRLGGWTSEAGERAVAALADHRRRAESDLHVLRTLTDATHAASSGIEQLLTTWYRTVTRLSAPLIADVPVPEIPAAVAAGHLPATVVVDDVAARENLYFRTADTTAAGIDEILSQLTRATEDMDVEPYAQDPAIEVPPARPAEHTSDTDAERRADTDTGDVDVPLRLGTTPGPPPPAPRLPGHADDSDGSSGDLALAGDQ